MSIDARFIQVDGGQAWLLPPDGGERINASPDGSAVMFFKMTGDQVEGLFDYFEIRVTYLGGPPVHIHLLQHETFHILEGALTVKVGDQMVKARQGDYLHIPKGVPHAYVNLHEGTVARAVGNVAPGGLNKFMAEYAEYLHQASPVDPKVVAEMSARYKQAFAGPPLAVQMGLRAPQWAA